MAAIIRSDLLSDQTGDTAARTLFLDVTHRATSSVAWHAFCATPSRKKPVRWRRSSDLISFRIRLAIRRREPFFSMSLIGLQAQLHGTHFAPRHHVKNQSDGGDHPI